MARILVVDDSKIMRKNIASILIKAGHTVVAEAADGGEAQLMYRTHLPDLVTMDITMPGINGIDAVRLIREDYPNAKIIMVSALSQRNMVFDALEQGAKHYLIKPISYDSVVTIVQKVLGVETVEKAPKEKTLESTTQLPFAIESINNMFLIKITNFLTEENIKLLEQAVQGLLYVKPLNVTLDFGTIESLSLSLLERISGIVKAMKAVNGAVKVDAKNPDFIQLLRFKKIDEKVSAVAEDIKSKYAAIAEPNSGQSKLFPPEHKQYSLHFYWDLPIT